MAPLNRKMSGSGGRVPNEALNSNPCTIKKKKVDFFFWQGTQDANTTQAEME
jgi:hypothetical protein